MFDRRFKSKVWKWIEAFNCGPMDFSSEAGQAAAALVAPMIDSSLAWNADEISLVCALEPAKVRVFFERLAENGILDDGKLCVEADLEKIRDDDHEWHCWLVEFWLIVGCAIGEVEKSA